MALPKALVSVAPKADYRQTTTREDSFDRRSSSPRHCRADRVRARRADSGTAIQRASSDAECDAGTGADRAGP